MGQTVRYKCSSTFRILLMVVFILVIAKISARVYEREQLAYAVRAGYYFAGSSALYCMTVHIPRMIKGMYVLRKIRRIGGTER